LLTWNLNARRNVDDQVAAIATCAPDVVALQEVTARTVPLLRATLLRQPAQEKAMGRFGLEDYDSP
jgi:endonuclease/exonuclease/phosphatase family metal-dependent hydrolase